MHGAPPPLHDAVTVGDHPQRQVGVFPVGPAEALIEPTDPVQRGAAVGHVRGDPPGGGQAGGAALEVGRSPVLGQRHLDLALAGADVRAEAAQVLRQLRGPVGSG